MARDSKSFFRKESIYKPQATVLVICEDSVASKVYLEDASHYFMLHAVVRVTHKWRTDTLGIVKEAIAEIENYDTIYCVVDRDNHPSFDRALDLARQHASITVIKSYPCYEYWLLLHFLYTRKPFERAGKHSPADQVVRELRTHDGIQDYDKGTSRCFSVLLPRLREAMTRATRAMKDAIAVDETYATR